MPQATIHNQPIHYEERGQGTPLVLLHGFPLDRRIWSQQIDALSTQCRVIAPDLPGFGESRGEKPFTLDSLADELEAAGDTDDPKVMRRLMREIGKEMGEDLDDEFEQMMEEEGSDGADATESTEY